MILQFHLSVDGEQIRASAPDLGFSAEAAAIAGIDTRTRQIVAVGETAEQVQAHAPDYWERHGRDLAFVRPFDLSIEEPAVAGYKSLIAARLVAWYAGQAAARWRRDGFLRQVVGPWIDTIDYHLDLPAFGRLGSDRRRELVGRLRQVLPSLHGLYINGERLAGR